MYFLQVGGNNNTLEVNFSEHNLTQIQSMAAIAALRNTQEDLSQVQQ
jgi:hypothetical protein